MTVEETEGQLPAEVAELESALVKWHHNCGSETALGRRLVRLGIARRRA